ncbi:MAG TPA: hypothetical protein VEP90_30815 [Methylomirabilota bacterium]|nr:hypothetical protein [Methylomirabilota bacterium]
MNFFTILGIASIVFIFVRAAFYLLVEVPRGHARDEAICEKCFNKRLNDDVTELMEWCHCPQKEDGSDKHEDREPEHREGKRSLDVGSDP